MSWPPAKRACAACGKVFPQEEFSNNQWRKGIGLSRCRFCVAGVEPPDPARPSSARRSESNAASFDSYSMDNPFASGSFRLVAKGKYTEGPRQGQTCVGKWFKRSAIPFEASFYESDIKNTAVALRIIEQWNSQRIVKLVQLNIPSVWTFREGTRFAGRKMLVEPFIEGYTKFNSNTGWTKAGSDWSLAMQALSHYSYHLSSSQYVLCDLQGGLYSTGPVLSDPVILSQDGRFGVTDLGPKGIRNFFAHHRCNRFCKPEWTKPRDAHAFYTPVEGSTMELRGANSRDTRPFEVAFTGLAIVEE